MPHRRKSPNAEKSARRFRASAATDGPSQPYGLSFAGEGPVPQLRSRRPRAGIHRARNRRDATDYAVFLGLHVNTANPPPNALVSTSSKSVLIPSSNRRVPLPRTTGYIQNLNSSARSCSISVFAS